MHIPRSSHGIFFPKYQQSIFQDIHLYTNGHNHQNKIKQQFLIHLVHTYLLHFTLKSTRHALALKPKPLVLHSKDRGRDPGSLKKWHLLPRLWHRSPRLSALFTESEFTAQSLPCAVFALSIITNDKDFLFA